MFREAHLFYSILLPRLTILFLNSGSGLTIQALFMNSIQESAPRVMINPRLMSQFYFGGGVIWVQNRHGRDTMCCCVHLQRNVEFVPRGCHFCMFQALLLGPSHLE